MSEQNPEEKKRKKEEVGTHEVRPIKFQALPEDFRTEDVAVDSKHRKIQRRRAKESGRRGSNRQKGSITQKQGEDYRLQMRASNQLAGSPQRIAKPIGTNGIAVTPLASGHNLAPFATVAASVAAGKKLPLSYATSDGKSNGRGNGIGKGNKLKNSKSGGANFSLEFSYPAVTFENVCFSVDRSQQQANFLAECLHRLKSCVGPTLGLASSRQERRVEILKSINLHVPYGSIFGLLGPSSCGKTTLLRCLVGLLEPSAGSIRLFGHETQRSTYEKTTECAECAQAPTTDWQPCDCNCSGDGHKSKLDEGSCLSWCRFKQINHNRADKCKVPGANVGYMPQDLGLYEDFSIRQLLTMFGRYMRMPGHLIEERIQFMAQFLELPAVERLISSLSGGQKRRVSFAIACLHGPPLIILDEPTVGVDPLLRRSIWKYLRRLASEENTTIIITTHYIEEAAQADQVALMRAGCVLVQDTPARIMQSNQSKTLEEAFLKICNKVASKESGTSPVAIKTTQPRANGYELVLRNKLFPQPKLDWRTDANLADNEREFPLVADERHRQDKDRVLEELKLRAQEKLALFDMLQASNVNGAGGRGEVHNNIAMTPTSGNGALSMAPNFCLNGGGPHNAAQRRASAGRPPPMSSKSERSNDEMHSTPISERFKSHLPFAYKRHKFTLNNTQSGNLTHSNSYKPSNSNDDVASYSHYDLGHNLQFKMETTVKRKRGTWRRAQFRGAELTATIMLLWALIYKNYLRNAKSVPLLAFQFMLPIIQMVSFSLCVGGRPTGIGLGLVNHDSNDGFRFGMINMPPENLMATTVAAMKYNHTLPNTDDYSGEEAEELLSLKYLSFIDHSMISIKHYNTLSEALADVRDAKLWAAMEIGANFTNSVLRRFDLDNFYQLEANTVRQSAIRLFPDRSNKVLDMICHRSLVNSYRQFLSATFEHFKRLPIEMREPIFDIQPNAISNSIDGYTESIAPGLLASLTYIMAAGLTTFIMVVERSAGILERTFTSGISPVAYLVAHALFRSLVMMLQIALVILLTFYVLKQPLVGSIWLAYAMLMVLNVTGIAYGLLISSIVSDQNGAALTIVSSLVVKITLSGILWPFEAIPNWLRVVCYVQPLTMPVQALKAITLKGAKLGDSAVNLGFITSICWLIVFLSISTKRFRFYQH